MGDSLQDLLKKAWHGGRKGSMSPLSEARAWALREIWRDAGKPEYGMLTYIAGKVRKNGGGSPTHSAMSQFFAKVDWEVFHTRFGVMIFSDDISMGYIKGYKDGEKREQSSSTSKKQTA